MLLGFIKTLDSKKFILGSQSINRRKLLQSQNIKFQVVPSTFSEDLDKKSFPGPKQYNIATCKGKAQQLLTRFDKQNKQWDILLCCDTIAELQGQIIQKPTDFNNCIKMINTLSGKWHKIYTTHFLIFNHQEERIRYQWVSEAQVMIGKISQESLIQYAKLSEPYLFTGGYEISGVSGSILQAIKGNFGCVQGIDLYQLGLNLIKGMKQCKWI